MPASVSAVVVAWRHDPAAIRRLVAALMDQSAAPREVIVVDNEPGAPVAAVLDEAGSGARTLRPGRNVGYAAACNEAAAAASGDWLFFLNPDAEPAADVLERLLEAADERTAIV